LLIGNRVFVVRRGLGEFAGLASARDSGFDEGPPIAGGVIGRAAPVGIGIDAVGVLQGDGVDDELATNDDATEHHFTQKERDTESGNDYFLARYYSSALGRFTTPDWSAKTDPVPYAVFTDPQSLNLYAYVRNNPLTRIDAAGHCNPSDWGCNSWSGSGHYAARESAAQAKLAAKKQAQQQNGVTAKAKGNKVTYTYPDGSKVVLKGDHPFRDNNPGDLRSGHGSIGRDGGFAIYPSLQAGVDALGATLTGKYGDSSIADTMKAFAPASDGNDPVKYAATLASAVGVPASTKISALTSAQLMTFQYTIANAEGYSAAGNTASYTAPPQQWTPNEDQETRRYDRELQISSDAGFYGLRDGECEWADHR